jgi:hypothetical protein
VDAGGAAAAADEVFCATAGLRAASETSAAVARRVGILDMEECYPVEAFPLPSDVVGLGDSVRFTAPVPSRLRFAAKFCFEFIMRIGTEMRRRAASHTIALLFGISLLSCSENPVAPSRVRPGAARRDESATRPSIVISQIYGGGGNSGAPLKNGTLTLHFSRRALIDAGVLSASTTTLTLTGSLTTGVQITAQLNIDPH